MRRLAVLGVLALLAEGSCGRPSSRIVHFVAITLKDAAKADRLVRECDERLARIDDVERLALGRRLPSDRPEVQGDYHVGVLLAFPDASAYRRYVEHPEHVALVRAWAPEIASLRVFDVLDESP